MDAEMEIREIQALMRLIDEPDSSVFLEITRKIHSYGNSILPFLEGEWERTADPLVQSRLEKLIRQIRFESVSGDLAEWVRGGCKNLLQASLIVARYHYPDLDETDVEAELARIRKDVWLELNESLTALEQIKVFNHVFYDVYGFAGNARNYHSPSNSYLNQVLTSRTGNPLSMGIIYMTVAQSLDMPVFGVNLPEHFVLAYTQSEFDPGRSDKPENKILFYINAFSRGSVFNHREVVDFLKHLGYDAVPKFFSPCRNEDIIRRMLSNLANAYGKEDETDKAGDMEALRDLLSPPDSR